MAIIKHPSAPVGYGVDEATGNFVKLPEEPRVITPPPASDTSRYIKDTEMELGTLQNQKEINPTNLPTGVIERDGMVYTVDAATGNVIPLGSEYKQAATERRIEDKYNAQAAAYGRRIDLELEAGKEEEGRVLKQNLSTEAGVQGVSKGLGFSSTELSVLAGIEDRSKRRIKDLEREAEKAKIDFNFKLMDQKRAEIKEERDRARNREQTLFDRLFKLKETEKTEKDTALTQAAYAYMNSLPLDTAARDAKIKEIATAQGLDYDALKTKLNVVQFERGKEIWDVAKGLNVGQTYTMPDGTIISGTDPIKADLLNYEISDTTGTYAVGLEKTTGKLLYKTKIGTPKKNEDGTTSTGVKGMEQSDLALVVADVESIRGSDGLLDTGKYAQIRAEISKAGKEAVDWLDKTYPPENNLNPNDATARRFFRGSPGTSKMTPTPTQEAQDMRDQGMNQDAIEANLISRKFTKEEVSQAMKDVFPKNESGSFWQGLFDWQSRVQQ